MGLDELWALRVSMGGRRGAPRFTAPPAPPWAPLPPAPPPPPQLLPPGSPSPPPRSPPAPYSRRFAPPERRVPTSDGGEPRGAAAGAGGFPGSLPRCPASPTPRPQPRAPAATGEGHRQVQPAGAAAAAGHRTVDRRAAGGAVPRAGGGDAGRGEHRRPPGAGDGRGTSPEAAGHPEIVHC